MNEGIGPTEKSGTKDELISILEAAREQLIAAVEGLPPDDPELEEGTVGIFDIEISPGLTVRKIIVQRIEGDLGNVHRADLVVQGKDIDLEPYMDREAFYEKSYEGFKDASRNLLTGRLLGSFIAIDTFFKRTPERHLFKQNEQGISAAGIIYHPEYDISHAKAINDWNDARRER